MLCFVGMYKSLIDNRHIGVTARKYHAECVQLWRVVGVADNLGTLADVEGGFSNVAKSCAAGCSFSSFLPYQLNGMQLDAWPFEKH